MMIEEQPQSQWQAALANSCYAILRLAAVRDLVEFVKSDEIRPRKPGYFLLHVQGHLVRIRALPIKVHNLIVLARHNAEAFGNQQSSPCNIFLRLTAFQDQLDRTSSEGCDWYPPHTSCFLEVSNRHRRQVTLGKWLEEHVVDTAGSVQAGSRQRSIQASG